MNWNWTLASAEPIHFYHSKLWEEKAKDLFYEIFHNVVIPVHIALYGHPPPQISDNIKGNLGNLAYWFIEENFSYFRDFGWSVPPYALTIGEFLLYHYERVFKNKRHHFSNNFPQSFTL
jgi:hypothetical protein